MAVAALLCFLYLAAGCSDSDSRNLLSSGRDDAELTTAATADLDPFVREAQDMLAPTFSVEGSLIRVAPFEYAATDAANPYEAEFVITMRAVDAPDVVFAASILVASHPVDPNSGVLYSPYTTLDELDIASTPIGLIGGLPPAERVAMARFLSEVDEWTPHQQVWTIEDVWMDVFGDEIEWQRSLREECTQAGYDLATCAVLDRYDLGSESPTWQLLVFDADSEEYKVEAEFEGDPRDGGFSLSSTTPPG